MLRRNCKSKIQAKHIHCNKKLCTEEASLHLFRAFLPQKVLQCILFSKDSKLSCLVYCFDKGHMLLTVKLKYFLKVLPDDQKIHFSFSFRF